MVKDIVVKKVSSVYETRRGEWTQWSTQIHRSYFSVTGATTIRGRHSSCPLEDNNAICFGMLHEDMVQNADKLKGEDALLPRLIRWHLFDVRSGPMHYKANAQYWFQMAMEKAGKLRPYSSPSGYKDHHPDPLEAFKSTVVFGAVPDDEMPVMPDLPRPPDKTDAYVYDGHVAERRLNEWNSRCRELCDDVVEKWCDARFPALMKSFEADMVAWFGEGIIER